MAENPHPQKPWKAEYAKSSRSSCKTCKLPIDKKKLRLGKMVHATQFEGFMPMWNHADCIMQQEKQIESIDDVEGLDLLPLEDQNKIRKYVQSSGPVDHASTTSSMISDGDCGIEVSPTSRATCKRCSHKILKSEVRISIQPEGQGPRGLTWHHANCFMELSPSTEVEKLSGWETLPAADQAAVRARGVKKAGGTKRRRDSGGSRKSKVAGSDTDVGDKSAKVSDLESKLDAQSKELRALKHDLKKHRKGARSHSD